MEDQLLFTPAALLSFLLEIEELQGKSIELNETEEGVVVSIDDAQYTILPDTAVEVEVDDEVLDAVGDAAMEGYTSLREDDSIDVDIDNEPVEGGIIKELIKTLAVGGLVRMTTNALKNS